MKILVNFPTRGRRKKFLETFSLYNERAENIKDIHYLIKVDIDDNEMTGIEKEIKPYSKTSVVYGVSGSKISAVNRDIPTRWDLMVFGQDDMIPVQGWDRLINETWAFSDTDGLSWLYDGYQERICTQFAIGEKYYKRFGYVYHPSYKGNWCDNEMTDVALALNRLKFIKTNIFFHEHPINNVNIDNDITYKNNDIYFMNDKKNYKERKLKGFKK